MNCNCIENSETKILDRLRQNHPEWDITDARYKNQALMFNDNDDTSYSLYFEFGYTYSFPKVNGEMSKPKNSSASITPSFCPFCGKSAKKDKEVI